MKRGATKLKAKRALEATIETGEAAIHVPTVADTKALARDLQKAGVRAAREIDEGVNALQPAISRELSHRLYIEAEESVVYRWYAERFAGLIQAAESDERSFYRQFVPLGPQERADFIQQVWDGINKVNLYDHIVHTKPFADTVIHMRTDHLIDRLEHQEQP